MSIFIYMMGILLSTVQPKQDYYDSTDTHLTFGIEYINNVGCHQYGGVKVSTGEEGDKINAILAGCGFNIRKLLRAILLWLFKERFSGIINDWITLARVLKLQFQTV